MPYRLTRRAQAQKKAAIRARAAGAGFYAAEKLNKAFDRTFEMLARFPEAGSARPDLTKQPVRLFPCDVYWVVHQPNLPYVDIVAIIDMRRQLEDALAARR